MTSCSLFTFKRWRRKWQHTPVFLPGESQGWGSLVGCHLWGCTESDTTERLPFHFSLSCVGEGNGNTLQCSCLENPRDGGAWRAAVYGVAQSWTQLKRFSSSSSKLTAVKMSCKKRDSSPQRVSFTEVLDQEGAARPLGGTKLMPQERGNRCHLCKKSVLKML